MGNQLAIYSTVCQQPQITENLSFFRNLSKKSVRDRKTEHYENIVFRRPTTCFTPDKSGNDILHWFGTITNIN